MQQFQLHFHSRIAEGWFQHHLHHLQTSCRNSSFSKSRICSSTRILSPAQVSVPEGVSEELTDFQALNYIASHNDLISSIGTDIEAAKSHYRNFGKVEGRALDDFDEWGYLASNNDLLTNFGGNPTEAVKNYISFGKSEGRSTTIFNADSYLNNYADLKSAFGNDHTLATKHYVESGFITRNLKFLEIMTQLRILFGQEIISS